MGEPISLGFLCGMATLLEPLFAACRQDDELLEVAAKYDLLICAARGCHVGHGHNNNRSQIDKR